MVLFKAGTRGAGIYLVIIPDNVKIGEISTCGKMFILEGIG
jgi:hypothetical protein